MECKNFVYQPISLTWLQELNFRYIFPVQFAIGVVTNFINIIILTRRDVCTKTNAFLAAMSLADLLFFLAYLPFTLGAFAPFAANEDFIWFLNHTTRPIMWTVNGLAAASIWLTVAVTIERFVAVCFPIRFYGQNPTETNMTIRIICSIYLLAFVLSADACFGISTNTILVRNVNDSVNGSVCIYHLAFINSTANPYLFSYVTVSLYVRIVMVVLIPFALLVILNSFLLRSLRKMRLIHLCQRARQRRDKEVRITRTVVSVILSFLIFNVPSVAIIIASQFITNRKRLFMDLHEAANILVSFGRMTNFFVYFISNKTFRRELVPAECLSRSVHD